MPPRAKGIILERIWYQRVYNYFNMGKKFKKISKQLQKFIEEQKIFFVATAVEEGRVNLSPKGMDTLKVLNENEVIWLNLTGSGNETAAHILQNDRMTIMFCSFDKKPLILRLYGHAEVYHERDAQFQKYQHYFPEISGSRQIFKLKVDLVQTSCGYGVPYMEYKGKRDTLELWAEEKGEIGIKAYWKEKNTRSLDGLETQIFPE